MHPIKSDGYIDWYMRDWLKFMKSRLTPAQYAECLSSETFTVSQDEIGPRELNPIEDDDLAVWDIP